MKDLLKATGLATVVFTLVMTVFAVIEPLRNRGLSGIQAIQIFSYSMPVMFSFTLPVAVLFATTIVYGRFAQDNELMACRASGISTIALLSPAVWLGLVVTLITLALTLYVAPELLGESKAVVDRDLERIVFHGLRSQRQVDIGGGRIFHADQVDPENKGLGGVIGLDAKNPSNPLIMAASKAHMEFARSDDGAYVAFNPENPVVFRQFSGVVAREDQEGIQRTRLDEVFDDEPRSYDLTKLLRVLEDPRQVGPIRTAVDGIQRQLLLLEFNAEARKSIADAGKYALSRNDSPASGPDRIEIQAKGSEVAGKDVVLFNLKPSTAPGAPQPEENPIVVRFYRGNDLLLEMHAASASLASSWDDAGRPKVWVNVRQAQVSFSSEAREIGGRHDTYLTGPFVLPETVAKAAPVVNLDDLLNKPEQYQPIAKDIAGLRTTLTRLTLKTRAEMHMRLAYSTSCLFMVMMGAALGMLLRGGQALSAFAIGAVPATIVILILFMGKQIMRNPNVHNGVLYGTVAMWSGVGLLALATLYVYVVSVRR